MLNSMQVFTDFYAHDTSATQEISWLAKERLLLSSARGARQLKNGKSIAK